MLGKPSKKKPLGKCHMVHVATYTLPTSFEQERLPSITGESFFFGNVNRDHSNIHFHDSNSTPKKSLSD